MRWLFRDSRVRALLLIIALLVGRTPVVLAKELPDEVTLPQLLSLVRERNPDLHAVATRIDAAEAELRASQALPNPQVSYNSFEPKVLIRESWPVFGQRRLQIESARMKVDAVRASVESADYVVLREVAHAFNRLLVAQERKRIWKLAGDDLESATEIVRGQVEWGARSRYDLARIELERARLQAEIDQSDVELANSAATLAAAVGAPDWRPVADGSLQPSHQAFTFEALWPQAQERLPALRAAAAEQAAAQKRVDLTKREVLPTPSFTIGEQHDGGGSDRVYGVSVTVPIFDHHEGPIARADAEAAEAQWRSTAAQLAAEAELRRATEQLARCRQLSGRFERDGFSKLPELRGMARNAYTSGRGNILDLIDSMRAVAEAQIAHLDLMGAVLQAEVDVHAATGELVVDQ